MPNYYLFALRPKHWVKNFFVFLPLIFGHKLFDLAAVLSTLQAFLIFCIGSSAIYLINDVIDYQNDKVHPLKKLRPIASGHIKREKAIQLSLVLIALSLFFSLKLGWILTAILATYLIVNLLYSVFLKHLVIIDVFCLSLFFILRLLAGTYAADVALSRWILLMGGLLALFLGFNKRRQEFQTLGHRSTEHRTVLKKYNLYFIDQMVSVVTASTVVAYTFYTVDARTVAEVGSDHMLYTVPFVYYGIFRYLYLLHQRRTDGDPTRVLLSDFPMQLNLLFWIVMAIAVIYFKI